ncbi:MAG: hypothetical protein IBX69_18485 [Anaerolineales bacterium]|nr:hypothetical protein [Anaerolineales bacterium]
MASLALGLDLWRGPRSRRHGDDVDVDQDASPSAADGKQPVDAGQIDDGEQDVPGRSFEQQCMGLALEG